jgi:predicted lipid-binding transport protein (Tim44 family)
MLTIAAVMLAATTWLAADVADAKRLGGGRSFGAQRQMTPAPSTADTRRRPRPTLRRNRWAPRTAPPATPAAAPSGMSRWLGPIAGLAAGLGLAALLSHFGLSESFASFHAPRLARGRRHLPRALLPRAS